MRISDWSSDVCSSDLFVLARYRIARRFRAMESGESPPKPRILFVISTRIGGVPQTNADLMRGLEGAYDSLALRCNRREIELLRLGPGGYETVDCYLLGAPIDFATHVDRKSTRLNSRH